ncbi:MAG: class I SAM-dependent methyltransferase [Microthrixaceae bacterium]
MTAEPAAPTVIPEYGRYYYEHYDGNPYGRSPAWMARMGQIADAVQATLKPESVLDAGCAMGVLVESLRNRGIEAEGVDISEFAIAQVPEQFAPYCRQASLAEPLDKKYDLVISIEVLEHIPEVELQKAIDNLCGSTDRILFSSTPFHYEDPTHINIKQPEQWSVEFAKRGFFRDVGYDASFIEMWSALYVRRPMELEQVVEQYDRDHWYQKREIFQTRQGIVELQAALAKLEDAVGSGSDGSVATAEDRVLAAIARAADAEAEAKRQQLMLTDEIIGSKAATGEALGRVAELEAELIAAHALHAAYKDRTNEVEDLRQHIKDIHASTTWRIIQKLMTPYRRIRGLES